MAPATFVSVLLTTSLLCRTVVILISLNVRLSVLKSCESFESFTVDLLTVSVTVSPILCPSRALKRSASLSISFPSKATIMSPIVMPCEPRSEATSQNKESANELRAPTVNVAHCPISPARCEVFP